MTRLRRSLYRARQRFDRFVVHRIYPQRPFLTFAPGACMTGVTVMEENGVLVVHVAADGLVRGVNGYDARVVLESGADLTDGLLQARRRIDPLVLCVPAPTSEITRSTFIGGQTAVHVPLSDV